MFATFLLVILLLTSIVMTFLLVMPTKERAPHSAPFMGIALFLFIAGLALFGAVSVIS
jgi:hypothetical protein